MNPFWDYTKQLGAKTSLQFKDWQLFHTTEWVVPLMHLFVAFSVPVKYQLSRSFQGVTVRKIAQASTVAVQLTATLQVHLSNGHGVFQCTCSVSNPGYVVS